MIAPVERVPCCAAIVGRLVKVLSTLSKSINEGVAVVGAATAVGVAEVVVVPDTLVGVSALVPTVKSSSV